MTRLEKLLTPGRRVKMTALWPTQDAPGHWFGTVHEAYRDDRLGVILKVLLLLDGENSPRWFGMSAYEFEAEATIETRGIASLAEALLKEAQGREILLGTSHVIQDALIGIYLKHPMTDEWPSEPNQFGFVWLKTREVQAALGRCKALPKEASILEFLRAIKP